MKPTGTRVSRREALKQEAGADEQHQRQRDFGDDERVARRRGATPWRRGPPLFSASTGDCRAANDDGDQAEDQSRRRATRRSENARTRPSTAISDPRGRPAQRRGGEVDAPERERGRRAMPPVSASSRLSLHIQRVRSQRLAPSASRTAASCDRAVARTSSRFATLAQAISSTSPTAPISTSSGDRALPTVRSRIGDEPQARVGIGVGVGRVGARVARARSRPLRLCACSTRTPGAIRATAVR